MTPSQSHQAGPRIPSIESASTSPFVAGAATIIAAWLFVQAVSLLERAEETPQTLKSTNSASPATASEGQFLTLGR
jgi:hypothetical protein